MVEAGPRRLAYVIVQTAPGVSGCGEREETDGERRAPAENRERREESLQVSRIQRIRKHRT